jgi:hypothetical protein
MEGRGRGRGFQTHHSALEGGLGVGTGWLMLVFMLFFVGKKGAINV